MKFFPAAQKPFFAVSKATWRQFNKQRDSLNTSKKMPRSMIRLLQRTRHVSVNIQPNARTPYTYCTVLFLTIEHPYTSWDAHCSIKTERCSSGDFKSSLKWPLISRQHSQANWYQLKEEIWPEELNHNINVVNAWVGISNSDRHGAPPVGDLSDASKPVDFQTEL